MKKRIIKSSFLFFMALLHKDLKDRASLKSANLSENLGMNLCF